MNSIMIGVRMPSELLAALNRRAAAERRSRSAMLILLVEAGLQAPTPTGATPLPTVSDDCAAPVAANAPATQQAYAR